jgi:hypothetical protein
MDEITRLLEKYNHFKDAQIRSIRETNEDTKVVKLVNMDDDGEDDGTVLLECKGIKESRILDGSVLPLLDMMSGVSIIKEHDLYGFALGSGTAMLHVHNAPLYIVASEMTISEEA